MKLFGTCIAGVWLLSAAMHPPGAQLPQSTYTSLYSSLDEKACKTTRFDDAESASEQICPGQGGFHVKVLDEDNRMSVTVVDPGGEEHPLRFDQVVTHSFCSLGARSEWRMAQVANKTRPIAMTVSLNANEDPANPAKVTSYLVVSRIAGAGTCVVKVLKSSASALDEARDAADHAPALSCLHP